MLNGISGKQLLHSLLLGAGVVIVTPLLTPGIIPAISDLGVITVGQAVSAGLAAFGVMYLLDQFMK